jgi:Na+/phosphate symporter
MLNIGTWCNKTLLTFSSKIHREVLVLFGVGCFWVWFFSDIFKIFKLRLLRGGKLRLSDGLFVAKFLHK